MRGVGRKKRKKTNSDKPTDRHKKFPLVTPRKKLIRPNNFKRSAVHAIEDSIVNGSGPSIFLCHTIAPRSENVLLQTIE